MIGKAVSHYRILEKLGRGGMGEVYLAQDTLLERKVALKFLPEEMRRDETARKRLIREAKSAAAIDHPYICNIHEIGECDGQDFIAMEYVQGKTLKEKLEEGLLPMPQAVRIADEIAEALGEAHKRNIVHRDLKPSNIMLTGGGHAKVMDFGLAKQVAAEGPPDQTETLTEVTADRSMLGTVPYMSPEQLRGQEADARSDVFSFGMILYQMLSGVHPFLRESTFATADAILNQDPPALRSYRPETPELLQHISGKALNKSREQRYQSIHEVGTDLALIDASIEKGSGFLSHLLSPATVSGTGPPARRFRRAGMILAAAGAASVLLATLYLAQSTGVFQPPDREPVSHLTSEIPLVTWAGDQRNGRISPDGEWVSFISDHQGPDQIWVLRLSGGEPKPLALQAHGSITGQVWSPDGQKICCLSRLGQERMLRIVPAFFGGTPSVVHALPEGEFDPHPIRWIGDSIYFEVSQMLWRFDLTTRTSQRLTAEGSPQNQRWVDVRQDERKIAFSSDSAGRTKIWMADLDGGNAVQLTDSPLREETPRWLDLKRILFLSVPTLQKELWQWSASTGAAKKLASTSAAAITDIRLDGEGMLMLETKREEANLWSIDAQSSRETQITGNTLRDFWPVTWQAGGAVFFQRGRASLATGSDLLDAQIFRVNLPPSSSGSEDLVVEDGYGPLASGDGKWLAYLQRSKESFAQELWVTELSSQRRQLLCQRLQPVRFSQFPMDQRPVSMIWSEDRPHLFFVARSESGASIIQRFRADSEDIETDTVVSEAQGGASFGNLRLSRSGEYLSYTLRSGDVEQLQVLHLPSGEARTLFPGSDANSLFCAGWLGDGRSMIIALRASKDVRGGSPVEIHKADRGGRTHYLADAERAFYSTARLDPQLQQLYIVGIDGLAHNLYALSLADKSWRRLTDNRFPGITYSGLATAPNGRLLYSRQESGTDMSMIRFNPQPSKP